MGKHRKDMVKLNSWVLTDNMTREKNIKPLGYMVPNYTETNGS